MSEPIMRSPAKSSTLKAGSNPMQLAGSHPASFFGAWRHRIAHLFGWSHGDVTWLWMDGKEYIGFKCRDCDVVEGVHEPNFPTIKVQYGSPFAWDCDDFQHFTAPALCPKCGKVDAKLATDPRTGKHYGACPNLECNANLGGSE